MKGRLGGLPGSSGSAKPEVFFRLQLFFCSRKQQKTSTAVPVLIHSNQRQPLQEEILSTFRIEQIDTSRKSVRRILSGQAPKDKEKHRIYGMKRCFVFCARMARLLHLW